MEVKRRQAVSHITKEDLVKIRVHLKEKNNIVLSAYISIGINAALTFSQLASLRFEDLSSSHQVKDKSKKIYLNSACKDAIIKLKNYYESLGFATDRGYLFKSLSPKNRKYKIDSTYTLGALSKIFRNLRDTLSLDYPIGTGSLKKTWYHFVYGLYKKNYEKVEE